MKILQVSTLDLGGGAARGAYWIHHALRQLGVDSRMFVSDKRSKDVSVITCPAESNWPEITRKREVLDEQRLAAYPRREHAYFSPASFTPGQLVEEINAIRADIVHLHWVAGGFVMPEDIPLLKGKIVWTLRDMWPLTGGCHYSEGCNRYTEQCGRCPVLRSGDEHDVTRELWTRKQEAWRNVPIHPVAVSHWMAECARRSSLFARRKIEVIHNGLSTELFAPCEKTEARHRLNLPLDHTILLFGALYSTTDQRKGFHYLQPMLEAFHPTSASPKIDLLVFGASGSDLKFPPYVSIHYLGTILDDVRLRLIYAAADVTIAPSIEDACPKVPIESMACGTPVVCFDATGMKDIVDHQHNGYRAQPYEPEDLARGVEWVLGASMISPSLSQRCRQKAEKAFSLKIQAQKYFRLYEKILAEK